MKCGRERQEGDRVATGRRQGGDRKTTGQRQESGREATGSDRQATGRRQGRCHRRATGGRQGGDRVATGRSQVSDSNAMVCHSVGSARRPGHIPTPSHSWTSSAFSNIKKFGLFHRVKSRGGSYEYNELTYFFLAACVLHNCGIQFDLQNGCEPTAERPCKCA